MCEDNNFAGLGINFEGYGLDIDQNFWKVYAEALKENLSNPVEFKNVLHGHQLWDESPRNATRLSGLEEPKDGDDS